MGLRWVFALGISTAWAGAAGAAPLPELLAPAAEGRMQCFQPDEARRVCMSLAGYSAPVEGVLNDLRAVVSVEPPAVVIRTVAPVSVRGDAVCGVIGRADIDGAELSREGAPVTGGEAEGMKRAYAANLSAAGALGREICVAFEPAEGGGFTARASVGGQRFPMLDQRVIWVRPEAGWRVAP